MGRYVARRLLQLIPVFIGSTFLIFAMVFAMPGDPIQRLAGERRPDPARVRLLTEQYNLDDPLVIQYLKYMGNMLKGDFGSNFAGRPVSALFAESWPVTVKLAATAFAFEIVIGMLAGVLAGLRRGGFIDRFVLMSTLVVVSIPVFVLGFTLQLVVGVKFKDVFHLPVQQPASAVATLLGTPTPHSALPYFWSEQYGLQVQLVGSRAEGDVVTVVHGSVQDRAFVATYERAGALVAVLGVGAPGPFNRWRRTLRTQTAALPAALSAPAALAG